MSDEKFSFFSVWKEFSLLFSSISNAKIKWKIRNEDAGCEINFGYGFEKRERKKHPCRHIRFWFACIKSISFEFYSSYSQFILCVELSLPLWFSCIYVYIPLTLYNVFSFSMHFIELDVDMPWMWLWEFEERKVSLTLNSFNSISIRILTKHKNHKTEIQFLFIPFYIWKFFSTLLHPQAQWMLLACLHLREHFKVWLFL